MHQFLVCGYSGRIERLALDGHSLSSIACFSPCNQPSYMHYQADEQLLLVVNEDPQASALQVWSLAEPERPQQVAHYPCRGQGPCHVNAAGDQVMICHYASGSLEVLRWQGGQLRPHFYYQQPGRGPHPERQQSAHFHCSLVTPCGHFVVVADLGTDQLLQFSLTDGSLVAAYACPPGCGPRTLKWWGQDLVVSYELADALGIWQWQQARLSPKEFHPTPTAEPAAEVNYPSQMQVDAEQRLWLANRGRDTLACWVRSDTGLQWQSEWAVGAAYPRHFLLLPEQQALCANQLGHCLTLIDLKYPGEPLGRYSCQAPTQVLAL